MEIVPKICLMPIGCIVRVNVQFYLQFYLLQGALYTKRPPKRYMQSEFPTIMRKKSQLTGEASMFIYA